MLNIRWEQTHAFLAKHVYAMTPKRTVTLSTDMLRCYLYRSQVIAAGKQVFTNLIIVYHTGDNVGRNVKHVVWYCWVLGALQEKASRARHELQHVATTWIFSKAIRTAKSLNASGRRRLQEGDV